MTLLAKRWYRSRRFQIITLILIVFSVAYYMKISSNLIEPDLDITRSSALAHEHTVVFKKPANPHISSIDNLEKPFNTGNSPVVVKPAIVINKTVLSQKPKVDIDKALKNGDRDSLAAFIENKIEEALKMDKGTGCTIPESDPFAPEIMKFDKKYPDIQCTGTDWVKCYLSECKVVKKILSTTEDISCTYEDIIYETDHKYHYGPPVTVKGTGIYKLENSDHVKIKCTGTHTNSYISSKWTGHHLGFRTNVERVKPPPGREDTLDVLIFGFDSTSRNGFIRKMPKSYDYLINHMDGFILNGYNILGDGTPAALFPILTGKTELELPDVRKVLKKAGTMDDMPFIFNRLKQDGYRTAYFEDMPQIGTFQYRFNGFKRQPADHYLRQFYIDEDKTSNRRFNKHAAYCIGDTPQFKLMINITDQFFKLDGKKFAFSFIADITHNDFNMISTADDATLQFLKTLKESKRLENTLLFMMGDHGARYANLRNTLQGKLEERLPLMFVRLPEKLRKYRPTVQAALEANANVLTTPHDIHATILDAIDLPKYYNHYRVKGADLKRGLSLLEPIPKNRSCSEAGIEPHWCACLTWTPIPRADPLYDRAATALLDYVNQLTEPRRDACIPRTLTSIDWVMEQRANSKMLSFVEARDADGYIGKFGESIPLKTKNYQIKIVVAPGVGIYEASLMYVVDEDKFLVDSTAISRINAYGEEPSCISATHPHLNMYCYCKNYVPKIH